MRSKIGVALAATLFSALALVAPARATFPGANGKIAFSSERNVTPTVHCAPGRYEVGCADIWTMNADGTDQTLIQSDGAEDQYPPYPAWSPNGQDIAFMHDYRPFNHQGHVFVMDSTGGNLRQVTSAFDYDASPTWSPNAARIAFSRDGVLLVAPVPPAGDPQLLAAPEDYHSDSSPDWSPDGALVAFVGFFGICNPHGGPCVEWSTIRVVDPITGEIRAVTTGEDQLDVYPSVSPDGRTIAFSSDRAGNGRSDLYTMPITGGTPTLVTDTPTFDEQDPVWSPDGKKIAFAGESHEAFGSLDIYTINADGTNREQLTSSAGNDYQPSWQALPRPPGPQRSDYKNGAQFCKAERDFLGEAAFTNKYGGGANAYGKCVSQNH